MAGSPTGPGASLVPLAVVQVGDGALPDGFFGARFRPSTMVHGSPLFLCLASVFTDCGH